MDDQSSEKIRAFDCKPERDAAPEGVSGNVGRGETKPFDKTGQIGNILPHAALSAGTLALAMAPPIVSDDLKGLRQL